ncbi:MAG: hypothetical protein J6I37_07145 [Prevotella sp.]|jgi:hypothetical protein|nr:hypothetical protein [Prevotella sp.]
MREDIYYYERQLAKSGGSLKACAISLSGIIILLLMCLLMPRQCMTGQTGNDTLSVRIDSVRDTVYVEVHDTMPAEKGETIIRYITLHDSTADTTVTVTETQQPMKDSLAVVQRVYSDDSSYTAYVSGVRIGKWPKLDSINVRRREITNTIHETVTVRKKQSRWKVGLQTGYGYGLSSKQFEPYVGLGVTCAFW